MDASVRFTEECLQMESSATDTHQLYRVIKEINLKILVQLVKYHVNYRRYIQIGTSSTTSVATNTILKQCICLAWDVQHENSSILYF